jgi:CheY-like chemotaxis protein
MNKSILVLDENSVIHGLVTSALETEGLTLHHEFNPGRYVERASSLMPDLILIGNSDRDPEYQICRHIKASRSLAGVPMVLLASSKEALTHDQLATLRVAGVVRKPFEASDLQQQVSKHLDLVDLIGSAYEYRQSQSTAEEGSNPLANLDVLDDEVLSMLRGSAPQAEAQAEPAPRAANVRAPAAMRPAATVVDDEVLAETLQPERAFEPLESEPQARPAPRFDSLETLEGEFPSQTLEVPESEAELEELGAADVLEEDTAEEAVFEPQGFDKDFEAGSAARGSAGLDDIEVELPEEAVDLPAMEAELHDGDVELFESDLSTGPAAAMEDFRDYEESIPLSVRRMMELKPVFTMTQEESAEEEVLEPFDFEADESEVHAIQEELEDLGEVDLDTDAEEVQEQELEFASEQDFKSMGQELEPPEDFDLMGDQAASAKPARPEPPKSAAPKPAPKATPPPEPELEAVELEGEEAEAAEIDTGFAEELAEEPAAAAPHPERTVQAVEPEPAEDEDFFVEEYLGDEEIDEEQIMAAEEDEGLEEAPELSAEDEAELDSLLEEDEHLADLDELEELEQESLVAEDAEGMDEEIELESEEEHVVQSSLRSEREADAAMVQPRREQPIFERNFNALQEEGASGPDGDETWQLEQDDGGFAIAEESEETAEVIPLHSPEPAEETAEMEEVPSSALEEVVEVDEELPPLDEELPPLEDEEAVSIEFGEGEADVFAETAEEKPPWAPKAPPSFVARPAEDFPQDVVKEPFTGPQGRPSEPEPPASPRHVPEEVLEDPDSLSPVLDEELEPHAATAAADLADSVQPHEFDEEEELSDEELPEPTLSALADEALGGVVPPPAEPKGAWDEDLEHLEAEPVEEEELDLELGAEGGSEQWAQDEQMADAFEPLAPETGDASADVTRGEMDALLGDETEEEPMEAASAGETLKPPPAAVDTGDPEFDNLFASLQEEIAANPEGEHLDDVLLKERIRDRALALEFALPQHENTFARALGVYELPGDGGPASAYPAALMGAAAAAARRSATPARPAAAQTLTERPAAPAAAAASVATAVRTTVSVTRSAADVSALSLLDPDIRAKLGQVLDEIISISVRKAVQEEMPKIMERMSRDA